MMNLIAGNLFAGVLFGSGGAESLFVIILSCVCGVGMLVWFLLKDPSHMKNISATIQAIQAVDHHHHPENVEAQIEV